METVTKSLTASLLWRRFGAVSLEPYKTLRVCRPKGNRSRAVNCSRRAIADDTVSLDHLFRLAQEAVQMLLKHARATLIQVDLDIQAALITLTVVDDGVGLPAPPIFLNRLGLRMMRYRADMIHGKLTITRMEPHGTRITCECPNGSAG